EPAEQIGRDSRASERVGVAVAGHERSDMELADLRGEAADRLAHVRGEPPEPGSETPAGAAVPEAPGEPDAAAAACRGRISDSPRIADPERDSVLFLGARPRGDGHAEGANEADDAD